MPRRSGARMRYLCWHTWRIRATERPHCSLSCSMNRSANSFFLFSNASRCCIRIFLFACCTCRSSEENNPGKVAFQTSSDLSFYKFRKPLPTPKEDHESEILFQFSATSTLFLKWCDLWIAKYIVDQTECKNVFSAHFVPLLEKVTPSAARGECRASPDDN